VSCRHDMAGRTCSRCYPATGSIGPGPESDYEDNLEGPGAVTKEEYLKKENAVREDHVREDHVREDSAELAGLMGSGRSPVALTPRRGYHHLKCWPDSFNEVLRGARPFEVRLNDRDFRVDDVVVLEEWCPEAGAAREAEGYTGRTVEGRITCVAGPRTSEVVRGAIQDGYVVLGVAWKL